MRILAIETTGQGGSVALLDEHTVAAEIALEPDARSAKTLAPAIQELLGSAKLQPYDIRLIAVATGPGSFTGLRIGATTAKTFAYAVRADVVGVNTLEVIAAQAPVEVSRLSAVLDAQRQQVFTGQFVRRPSGDFQWVGGTIIVDNDAWLASLDPSTVVSGPALEKLASRLPSNVVSVSRDLWTPRATTVGQLGWRLFQAGQRDDLWRLVPQYFRRSAAEEK